MQIPRILNLLGMAVVLCAVVSVGLDRGWFKLPRPEQIRKESIFRAARKKYRGRAPITYSQGSGDASTGWGALPKTPEQRERMERYRRVFVK